LLRSEDEGSTYTKPFTIEHDQWSLVWTHKAIDDWYSSIRIEIYREGGSLVDYVISEQSDVFEGIIIHESGTFYLRILNHNSNRSVAVFVPNKPPEPEPDKSLFKHFLAIRESMDDTTQTMQQAKANIKQGTPKEMLKEVYPYIKQITKNIRTIYKESEFIANELDSEQFSAFSYCVKRTYTGFKYAYIIAIKVDRDMPVDIERAKSFMEKASTKMSSCFTLYDELYNDKDYAKYWGV
jgi:hypothetical protein